jgi:hypothetical protein
MTTFPSIAPTVAKLIRLLASDQPGEIVASVHALQRVLSSAELDFHDLANAIEFVARREVPQIASSNINDDDMREIIRCCYEHADLLSAKELGFVHSMAKWRRKPTEHQLEWLFSIYERCLRGERSPC